MIYRILTEDVNREGIEKVVSGIVHSFTLYEATGYYESEKEKALVIEIDFLVTTSTLEESTALKIAKEIKKLNKQESVLVQRIKSHSTLV